MKIIQIGPDDNVVVAVSDIKKGDDISTSGKSVTAGQDVPAGHKIALTDIPEGGAVIKYGYPIGFATRAIAAGEQVHVHNLKTGLGETLEYEYKPEAAASLKPAKKDVFTGYMREDGRAGIRNEVWIIPTVGCVNSIGDIVAREAQKLLKDGVDGVYSFSHPYGCSQLGGDHENTKKALCGLIKHPNAGGVLVLGLGCENNTIAGMKEMLGDIDERRVKFLMCQDMEDEIGVALGLVKELIAFAAGYKREEIPVSKLVVGLKCGGSDGFSGITANPLVGAFSDKLVAAGGTTVLTEVPEMFGAETILMNRCENADIFGKTVKLINDFKDYFQSHGQPVYENPSPGNKDGGISTLEDKSLGCTQKSGRSPVVDVLSYGEAVKKSGLNLLNAPGNDLVASTALAVSGAQIVLFTTGRGTPFGSPVPTVKISSNTALAVKKPEWIDFDAGRLLSGTSMEALSDEFYEWVMSLASGKSLTKTEEQGIRDMAIFKTGVTL